MESVALGGLVQPGVQVIVGLEEEGFGFLGEAAPQVGAVRDWLKVKVVKPVERFLPLERVGMAIDRGDKLEVSGNGVGGARTIAGLMAREGSSLQVKACRKVAFETDMKIV